LPCDAACHPIPAAALITFCTKLCQPRRLGRDGNSNDRGSQTALVKPPWRACSMMYFASSSRVNYSASKSPAWPVLRFPLIAGFCEGRHRGFAHRRVAVRVAYPLALRTGALCALELRAERQPEGYLNRYQIPHGGLSLWQPARERMS
jgi:hypothetical protein